MTEIRRPEATPQRADLLYDAYLARKESLVVDGVAIPAVLEETFNIGFEAEERVRLAARGRRRYVSNRAYVALCKEAILEGDGRITDNPDDVGPEFVSTLVRYTADRDLRYAAESTIEHAMVFNTGRTLADDERPKLVERPVRLAICRGPEAERVLARLGQAGVVRVADLVCRGLAPTLYPQPQNPQPGVFYQS